MPDLRQKKILYQSLLKIAQNLDEISVKIDSEIFKTKALDQIALTLPGLTITLQLLLGCLHGELAQEEDNARLQQEFQRLFDEEQRRFEPKQRQIPPAPEEDGDFGEEEV